MKSMLADRPGHDSLDFTSQQTPRRRLHGIYRRAR
jgi:hypothetical protein